jgi:hypothetical protein
MAARPVARAGTRMAARVRPWRRSPAGALLLALRAVLRALGAVLLALGAVLLALGAVLLALGAVLLALRRVLRWKRSGVCQAERERAGARTRPSGAWRLTAHDCSRSGDNPCASRPA